jgi:hypothetical protein
MEGLDEHSNISSQPLVLPHDPIEGEQHLNPAEIAHRASYSEAIDFMDTVPRPFLGVDGVQRGFLFNPKEVRERLTRSGMFEMREIKCWRQYVVTPLATSSYDWILKAAAYQGLAHTGILSFGRLYNAPTLTEDRRLDINADNGFFPREIVSVSRYSLQLNDVDLNRNRGIKSVLSPESRRFAPAIATECPTTVDLGKICNTVVDPSFPPQADIWKVRGRRHFKPSVAEIATLEKWLEEKQFDKVLYRGYDSAGALWGMIESGMVRIPSYRSDFGTAQYYTDDYETARMYAYDTGVSAISIHDWKEQESPCTAKILEGDEWTRTVQYWVSHLNPDIATTQPVTWDGDFWVGKHSSDHDPVFRCQSPNPTSVTQFAAKTNSALELMASRLVGIIVFG